jgi:hypothetical protein
MTELPSGDGPPRNPSVRHERTDVEAGGILLFASGLVLLVAFTAVGVWGLFRHFLRAGPPGETPPWAGVSQPLPPEPRLEGLDLERSGHDIGRMWVEPARRQAEAEEAYLRSYGWVSGEPGRVHIPIEEAMKRLAGRLPARPGVPVDEFLEAPSRSSSGQRPRGGLP